MNSLEESSAIKGSGNISLAIMQPYFLPYIGYFQLINSVDQFVVYDNVQYTKKGWINRNRMLQNGKDVMFSLPLKKDSDYLDVVDRELSSDFSRDKLCRQVEGAYRRAPFFDQTFPLIEKIIKFEDQNLFQFLYHSIITICRHLGITTEIKVASSLPVDSAMKSQDKVLALCLATGSACYVNAIGGIDLYSKEVFVNRGIELKFLQSKNLEYQQFGDEFVPWLSIIDVLMFNPLEVICEYIDTNYSLL